MGNNSSVLALNDDMIWEIVVRLPTKCVSKQWNKIITDPLFVKSHKGGFHGLLLPHSTQPYGYPSSEDHEITGLGNTDFPYANRFFDDMRNSNIPGCYQLRLEEKYIHYYDYGVTNIEKGLCVFNRDGAFTLCNIAAHQLLDLPIISPEEECLNTCYLGFEPVRGVYKLVRFFYDNIIYQDIDASSANVSRKGYLQICTLGGEQNDLDWRSIGEATGPTHTHFSLSIWVNGILYLGLCHDNLNQHVVAFDLSTETAPQFIPLPDASTEGAELIQVGGSPGLIHLTDEMSTIRILKDNKPWRKSHSVELLGVCRTDYTNWEVVDWRGICDFDITYVGTLPTGEMLLAPTRVTKDNPVLPIYKYDHIRDKLLNWTELSIPFYVRNLGEYCHICYHEDNIVPLESMITRSNGFSIIPDFIGEGGFRWWFIQNIKDFVDYVVKLMVAIAIRSA